MKPLDVLTVGMLTAAVVLPSDAVLADAARKPNIVVTARHLTQTDG